MASKREFPGRPKQSHVLDDLIMGTNSSSIVSKRSVERLYYPNEPHYFRFFVKKFQRRAPLINRGYWLRLRVIDVVVKQFLAKPSHKKVVVNLGCGSDVLPWQCHVRYKDSFQNTLFVDVDYPDLMRKKRDIVLENPQLKDLLGDDFSVSEDVVLLRSNTYCQVACDLRRPGDLQQALRSIVDVSKTQFLFVAEVSITYMDTKSADELIEWASSMGEAEFCLLEQLLPQGPDHPFAETMLSHFNKINTPPKSVRTYPSLESQQRRFRERGWRSVGICDLWQAWSDETFVTAEERAALDTVEPFDEWEEFMLFARHYFVVHASANGAGVLEKMINLKASTMIEDGPELGKAVASLVCNGPNRRFGHCIATSNATGEQFVLSLMGLGSKGRADSFDIYSLHMHGHNLKLPPTGPGPRMCSTLTDLGTFGVLLVGGRNSPMNVFSDCWLMNAACGHCWKSTWKLPVPLFRHSTIRLKGSSLALVAGGKTGPGKISSDYYLFDPTRGWLTCSISGDVTPIPVFGAVLCNSVDSGVQIGVFKGLLAGGMGEDCIVSAAVYRWTLIVSPSSEPTIMFEQVTCGETKRQALSVFGASCLDLNFCTLVCGGTGQNPGFLGQTMTAITLESDNLQVVQCELVDNESERSKLFMIGSSIAVTEQKLIVFGGGATCFSMGTYWDTGIYTIELPLNLTEQHVATSTKSANGFTISFTGSQKVVGDTRAPTLAYESAGVGQAAALVKIPRIALQNADDFEKILKAGGPVIIENANLGQCTQNWTPEYMIERVGADQKVVVHECDSGTSQMDFNSKNFRYVTDTFGSVMAKARSGGRIYLRSLSQDNPSAMPAKLAEDFPQLAPDFVVPQGMEYVSKRLFSSILRVSGKVNMWLHYDVMSNVYAQIVGSKRMILFPPGNVSQLAFPPGASSSSLDVFSALEAGRLSATNPHEATLQPGDILFLPSLWLHTATPLTDMSVAVNVFFRHLDGGYAAGRDVYGNKDLSAYEKGRQDVARLASSFERLPEEARRFYLARLADELLQTR